MAGMAAEQMRALITETISQTFDSKILTLKKDMMSEVSITLDQQFAKFQANLDERLATQDAKIAALSSNPRPSWPQRGPPLGSASKRARSSDDAADEGETQQGRPNVLHLVKFPFAMSAQDLRDEATQIMSKLSPQGTKLTVKAKGGTTDASIFSILARKRKSRLRNTKQMGPSFVMMMVSPMMYFSNMTSHGLTGVLVNASAFSGSL